MTDERKDTNAVDATNSAKKPRVSSNLRECVEKLFNVRGGALQVVAIHPDRKQSPLVETFEHCDETTLRWIEDQNRTRNIYFTLNETDKNPNRKPSANDITSVYGVGFDCDPIKGVPIEREKSRYKHLAVDLLTKAEFPPTFVVFTGNGIQAVFLFQRPLLEFDREHITYVGKRLQCLPGADNTANIDRLYRLPGSINYPNQVKRERGCVNTNSALMLPPKGIPIRKYSLEDF